MKNLKSKILIGVLTIVIGTLSGIAFKSFMNEGTTYDVGWKSWDITANVLDNGDMEVHEKLVYFDDYYEDYEILEQGLSFDIAWTDQPYTSKAPNAEVLKKIEDFLSNIQSKL